MTLLEDIRAQVSAALRVARGDITVRPAADPAIPFSELPLIVGALRTVATSCGECGSLVMRDREADHSEWHRSLLRTIVNPPMLDAEPVPRYVGRSGFDEPNRPSTGTA